MALSLISFTFTLLLTIQLAIARTPMVKPNCADHCGNISIPYPFGLGKDCYMDEWFEIACDTTSYPPTAFLRRINMELLGIDLRGGTANVRSPIITSNCPGRDEGLPVNLTGSSFFLSDSNIFIAIGCNTRALLTHNTPQLVGCDSTCLARMMLIGKKCFLNSQLRILMSIGYRSIVMATIVVRLRIIMGFQGRNAFPCPVSDAANLEDQSSIWKYDDFERAIALQATFLSIRQDSYVLAKMAMRAILTLDAQDLNAAQIHCEEIKCKLGDAEAACSTWSSFATIGTLSIDIPPLVSNSW
ncbi:hypothetical protein GH714_032954 [Hevea brasiliensis]|uniref:Wall-associated receptor kinase galacturonan-binding domain-containing protein n=1 Tax=Hevea brasiliensis TaxID=3981 RepID=A0A6A6NDS7_HEVBR|nr:hypothetical protein GH714_032954 [Hevea brasiliensis]